jgi:hypothetical protein
MPPTHYQQPGRPIPPGGYPPETAEYPTELQMQPAAPMFQQPVQELPAQQAPGTQYLPPVEEQPEAPPDDQSEPPEEEQEE